MTRYAPRWFEAFALGDRFETARFTFEAGSISDFALTWDPQPFHLDAIYAESSVFGGVIASGFHTLVVGFRLAHQCGVFGHNQGGSGIDALRWPKPVRPGDTIKVKMTVAALNPRRTTGHLQVDWDVVNQDDDTVLTATMNYFIAKRPADG